MALLVEREKPGREPFTIIELDPDKCQEVYGVSPCTASGAAGSECFNTYATCQDVTNYNKGTTTVKLCSNVSNFPKGLGFIPCIDTKPIFTPTRLNPGKGLGPRGKVSVTVQDFTWPDRDVDPYWDTRLYDPVSRGTFWGKFKARNKHIEGRAMRVLTGYLADGYDATNFRTRLYIIDKIEGPDAKGNYTIHGKDPIALASDKKAKIPTPNSGKLSADLTAVATSFSVGTGEGADYAASGTLAMGKEIMTFTRSTDTFTVTRGQENTEATEHTAGDLVQESYVFTDENICDLLYTILTTYAGIDGETYIPYDAGHAVPTGTNLQWDDQYDAWLNIYNLTGAIAKPKGVYTEIGNILASCNVDLYWDEVDQEIRLISNMPPISNVAPDLLTDEQHLTGSLTSKERPDLRVTDSGVWYGRINPLEADKLENYSAQDLNIDVGAKGADQYNQEITREIFARYLDLTNAGEAAATAARYLNRFRETPIEYMFDLDARHEDIHTGDLRRIQSAKMTQDDTGDVGIKQIQITEVKELIPGHSYRYKAISSQFNYLYGYIGPDTLNDYDVESDSNKQSYAFIAPDTGIFASDGKAAYRII